MIEFHHHPDGIVYLRAEGASYAATLDDFAADCIACGLPAYAGLPDGFRERRYLPDTLHALYSVDSQENGGEWPEGDLYLSARDRLLAVASQRGAT